LPDCAEAFVGVGSNVDPERNILSALPVIQSHLEVVASSRFYRNPAFSPDCSDLPPFVNGVLKIHTTHAPREFKYRVLRKIEERFRRRRDENRYGPRTLDLDLLVYGDLEIDLDGLVLPDPDISVRAFWAVPLAELVPGFTPPGSRLSMQEIVRTLDTRTMVCLESFTAEVRRVLAIVRA
jgi:2-amino-4-hydroxy-6-hydroxymethyldihydropteridine diphosphokinase